MVSLGSFTTYKNAHPSGDTMMIGCLVGLRTPTSIWTDSPAWNATGVTFSQATILAGSPSCGGPTRRLPSPLQPARRTGIRAMAAPVRIEHFGTAKGYHQVFMNPAPIRRGESTA